MFYLSLINVVHVKDISMNMTVNVLNNVLRAIKLEMENVNNFKKILFTIKNREDWNQNVDNFSTSMELNVIVLEDIIKLMEYVVGVQVIKFL